MSRPFKVQQFLESIFNILNISDPKFSVSFFLFNPNHFQRNKMQRVKRLLQLVALSREQKNHCSSWWILLH